MAATIVGEQKGINVWHKLAASTDLAVKEYFNRIFIASTKYGQVWFQDVERQYNGHSGLPIYCLSWIPTKQVWDCSVFMTTNPVSWATAVDEEDDDIIELSEDDLEEIV